MVTKTPVIPTPIPPALPATRADARQATGGSSTFADAFRPTSAPGAGVAASTQKRALIGGSS